MRRAVVLSADGVVDAAQLMFDDWVDSAVWASATAPAAVSALQPIPAPTATGGTASAAGHEGQDLQSAVRDREWHLVQAALAAAPSRGEAARMLGISPRTLRHKLAQWRAQGLGEWAPALQA